MKSLIHICQEAEQTLGQISHNLEKEVNSWIGDLNIIGHKINTKAGNVIFITEGKTVLYNRFSLFRSFPGSGEWHTSVDLNNVTQEKLIEHLLQHYK